MGLILVVCMTACAAPAAIPNAQALWDKGAYREAFASAIEAANAGDPHAEYLLGEAYRLGRSVEADQLQARNWYMRAARQGDVASAAALGALLVNMRQSRDAVPWLTLAASHNHAGATALLAAIYYTGDGADQDLILATVLMRKAAAEGSPEAKAKLAMMDDTAPPQDVSSPSPPMIASASSESPPSVQVAAALPAARIWHAVPESPSLPHVKQSKVVRIQVGAFRAAANARHALNLIAGHTTGIASSLAIVRNHGFYKLVLLADGRDSARIARARLVEIGWQHFEHAKRVTRA